MATGTTRISIDGSVVSTASNAQISGLAGGNQISIEGYLDEANISAGGGNDYLFVNLNNEGAAGSSDYVSFRDSVISGGNGADYIFVYNFPSPNTNSIIDTVIRGGNAEDYIFINGDIDNDASVFNGSIVIGKGSSVQGDGGLIGANEPASGDDYIKLNEVFIRDGGKVQGQLGNDYIYLDDVDSRAGIVNGNQGLDYIYVDNSVLTQNTRIIGGQDDDEVLVDDSLLTTGTWVNGSQGADFIFIEDSILDGFQGNEDNPVIVRGNDDDDRIFFYDSAGDNIKVNGNSGDDYIGAVDFGGTVTAGITEGGVGQDTAPAGIFNSQFSGGTGDDYIDLSGNTGDSNLLDGGLDNDVLVASKADMLFPDAGDGDRLDGGEGADWAFTGIGSDTYVFESGDGIAATGVLASNLFENFFTLPGEGNDFEVNALYWSEGVDLLVTQDGIGGIFDLLDDDVEFNGESFSVEDIVFFGSTAEVGIATINEQGDFVSVVEGTTSAYVVLGAFGNIAGEPFQPTFDTTAETAFATQYIEPGIGLNASLTDYTEFFDIGVNAALFFDAGESLGVGNDIGYEDVSDLFIATTRSQVLDEDFLMS